VSECERMRAVQWVGARECVSECGGSVVKVMMTMMMMMLMIMMIMMVMMARW
jgi:hypothetical protein